MGKLLHDRRRTSASRAARARQLGYGLSIRHKSAPRSVRPELFVPLARLPDRLGCARTRP
jgi:hypothetical protein